MADIVPTLIHTRVPDLMISSQPAAEAAVPLVLLRHCVDSFCCHNVICGENCTELPHLLLFIIQFYLPLNGRKRKKNLN